MFGDWIDLGHTRFPENFMLKASKARQLVLKQEKITIEPISYN